MTVVANVVEVKESPKLDRYHHRMKVDYNKQLIEPL